MTKLARLGKNFLGHPRGSWSKVSLEVYIYSIDSSSGSESSPYYGTAETGLVALTAFLKTLLGGEFKASAAGFAISVRR